MPDTKSEVKIVCRPDAVLLDLPMSALKGLNSLEAARMAVLLRQSDAERLKNDPTAKTIMPKRTYEAQPFDELCDVLNDLALGKSETVPDEYLATKLSKEQYQKLRDSLKIVVELGSKMVLKGHVFDLRFDQRGHGWAKFTENWRKNGPPNDKGEATNLKQEFFDSYKENPTVKLF